MGLVIEALQNQLDASGRWMAWNLTLALAPWLVSMFLFRPSRRPGPGWWCGAAAWLLLIPNAAYVLTDVLHLPPAVRREPSDAAVILGVFPLYATFFATGFTLYADAVRRVGLYVVGRGWARRARAVEQAVHATSAVAIYAGRIHRFNSWDVISQPWEVLSRTLGGFTRPLPLLAMAGMFGTLSIGFLVTRPVLQAASLRTAARRG